MFEILKMAGTQKKSIALDTRLGNPIENEIAPTPSDKNIEKDQFLYQNNILKWTRRVQSTGQYNCLGHVWASRRTSIYSEAARKLILTDDGYTELFFSSAPLPDDFIVYEDVDSGDYLHIGRVIAVSNSEIKILSKWDDSSGEYIHSPEDAPCCKQFSQIRLYYITERN
ncbi:MAG: hypothetical protein IH950_03210 [Bacteroidetes bacterium]|nr:hypothetical protein [Bacteroidota bacterium]